MASDSRLKILFAGTGWPLETFLSQLVEELCQRGHKVSLSSPDRPANIFFSYSNFHWLSTPVWKTYSGFGIFARLLFLMIRSTGNFFLLLNYIKNLNSLKEKLRYLNRLLPYMNHSWDVLYFPWNSSAIELELLFDLPGAKIISCRGSQVMVAPHNPSRESLKKGLERTFNKADLIHCVSESIQKEAEKYGLPAPKSRIIKPAVNTGKFQKEKIKPLGDKIKIVSVGNINWVKGLDYGIEALTILKKEEIPFEYRIIGKGPDQDRLLFNIDDCNLSEQVKYLGEYSPEQVVSCLLDADIFLLPSLSEGISNAALEAMACGCMVISSDCGGMAELIGNGKNGILVPAREPREIAREIINVWKDPEIKIRLAQRGGLTVSEKFNMDNQISDFESLFYEAVKIH